MIVPQQRALPYTANRQCTDRQQCLTCMSRASAVKDLRSSQHVRYVSVT